MGDARAMNLLACRFTVSNQRLPPFTCDPGGNPSSFSLRLVPQESLDAGVDFAHVKRRNRSHGEDLHGPGLAFQFLFAQGDECSRI